MKKTLFLCVGLLVLGLFIGGCTQDRSGGFGENNPKGVPPEGMGMGMGTTGSGIGAGVPAGNPASYAAPNPSAM